MIVLLSGLVGCLFGEVPAVSWTSQEALRPTFARLDLDRSGGIEPGEWTRYSYGGPAFAELDLDGTGALDLEELIALVRRIDPAGFDGERLPIKTNVAEVAPVTREIREVGDALLFLIEEIRGTPGFLLPAKEEVRDASWSESMRSPESRAVLNKLRHAWNVAGREFPSGPDWGEVASDDPPGSSP